MALLSRWLKTVGVLFGVLLIYVVMAWWSQRHSLMYLAVPASVTLAVAYSTRVQARLLTAAFFALAVVCAVSPVDLEFRTTAMEGACRRDPGIRVLPVSYGIRCVPGTLGKGCVVPRNPPQYAVVVSLLR